MLVNNTILNSNGVEYWPKISIKVIYCSTIGPWVSTLHCRTVVFIVAVNVAAIVEKILFL